MGFLEVLEAIGEGLNPVAIRNRARQIYDERLTLASNSLVCDLQNNQAVRLGAEPGSWTGFIPRNDGTEAGSLGIQIPGNQDSTDGGLLQGLEQDKRYGSLLKEEPIRVIRETLVDLGMRDFVVDQLPNDLVREGFERLKRVLRTGNEPAVEDRTIVYKALRWPLGEKATIGEVGTD